MATKHPIIQEKLLRVATFNIHHGADPTGEVDLARTARAIAALEVDAVLLQEVDRFAARSLGTDQVATLAGALSTHSAFGAALVGEPEHPGWPTREYGLAILSRRPLRNVGRLALPGSPRAEPRMLLYAEIDVDEQPVTLATAHLDDVSATSRARQAETILRALQNREALILGGDLNEDSGASAHRLLAAHWEAAPQGSAATFLGDDMDPEPARLDHLFSTANVECTQASARGDLSGISDHIPVVADFRPGRKSFRPRAVG